ncbi:MAG: hypothetical protein CSA22_10485 [Deltaproteobacteria bacterium]|nr:MAG: hypothetical protein CSA22_10485 [Deltaproteobacteria bacterium]
MPDIIVAGTGIHPGQLPPPHAAAVQRADILVAGAGLLDHFSHHPAEKWEIRAPLDTLIRQIDQASHTRQVVVLASGNPLFHGIGTPLVSALGIHRLQILANTSVVSEACARTGLPVDRTPVISLHHTGPSGFLYLLTTTDAAILLTSPRHDPAWIGGQMRDAGMHRFRCCVMEQLGHTAEQIRWMTVAEMADTQAASPNIIALVADTETPVPWQPISMGMPPNAFFHENSLITKPEVRVTALARLHLSAGQTLWDLGAGSGSISIEAAPFIKKGQIFAVEKNAHRIENIRRNIKKFGAFNVMPVHATLPEGLAELPDPDRIFIGGGGKQLPDILLSAINRLPAGGVLVITTVRMESLFAAKHLLHHHGIPFELVQLQVSAARPLCGDLHFHAQNPVWILSAVLPSSHTRGSL